MRPEELSTGIFLDSGNPSDTRDFIDLLGFLDGQTTNPTLVAKNPDTARLLAANGKNQSTLLNLYKQFVREISEQIPKGSVSIEVYADAATTADAMFAQAQEMYEWIPNAHIKFPTTTAGLECAQRSIANGMRVNMTLCFTQSQAAAVYAATQGAKPGDVFISPFIGRLDGIGLNGMDLIRNIGRMYASGDGHVQVLAASVRSKAHILSCLASGCDLITAPAQALQDWRAHGLSIPPSGDRFEDTSLSAIPFDTLDLSKDWQEYDIHHELTEKGLARFAADWNGLLQH